MADGHAVQELMKLSKLLYEASKQSEINDNEDNDSSENILSDTTIITKVITFQTIESKI